MIKTSLDNRSSSKLSGEDFHSQPIKYLDDDDDDCLENVSEDENNEEHD